MLKSECGGMGGIGEGTMGAMMEEQPRKPRDQALTLSRDSQSRGATPLGKSHSGDVAKQGQGPRSVNRAAIAHHRAYLSLSVSSDS